MRHDFHETLEEAPAGLPSERSTGLVLAGAALIGAVLWRDQPAVLSPLLAIAAALATVSLAAPALLRPLNRAWMALGQFIGRLTSPVIMLVLFCITIVPFGLAMQLRRDPLRRRPTTTDETYWITPDISFGPNDMTRQF